jgi:hypothetical protein
MGLTIEYLSLLGINTRFQWKITYMAEWFSYYMWENLQSTDH